MRKLKLLAIAALALITMPAASVHAETKYEEVTWPVDKNYDANIFLAEKSPALKEAYDHLAGVSEEGGESTSSSGEKENDQYADYYTSIQPLDKIKLGGTTILQDPIESYVNSDGQPVGIWHLPVLNDGYYYQLATNNWITIPDYTYPVLALKKKPDDGQNVKVYLRVYPRDSSIGSSAVAQFIITIPWNLSCEAVAEPRLSDASTLEVAQAVAHSTQTNIHAWAFEYSGTFRPYQTKFAVFGEDYVVALTEEPSDHEYYTLDEGASLIMSEKGESQTMIPYYGKTTVFKYGFLDVASMSKQTAVTSNEDLDLDIYNMWREEAESRVTYAIGPKQDINTSTVNSTHSSWHVKTKASNAYEREHGAMAAFFNKKQCHVVVFYKGTITDPYANMYDMPSANRLYMQSGQLYSLRDNTGDYFLSLVVDNPNSAEKPKDSTDTSLIDNYSYTSTTKGEPAITIGSSKQLKYYHNLAALSFWNAWMPTVGGIDAYDSERTYTISLDPDGGTVTPTALTLSTSSHAHINLPTPTKEKYKFVKWVWADTNLTFDETNFTPVSGETYKLKAVYQKELGQYSITFINDIKDTREKRVYVIDGTAPSLPENPVGDSTHTFKNWLVIDDTGATLSIYSPSTFTPKEGEAYQFLTNWDSKGVITDITLQHTNFYTGDTISKNTIKVTVRDGDGASRVLGTEEYEISPTTYDTAGWHQPTVLYKEAGATATFDVEFKEDKIKTLTAEYTGRDLPVGAKIDKDFINVTAVFDSGRQKTEDDVKFSITPQRIQKSGANKINVSAYGKTTNVTITGKEKSTPELTGPSGNGGDVDEIQAVYHGGTLKKGATISKADFEVTRVMADGTTQSVPAANIIIAPLVANNEPSTEVSIYYDGYTTTVDVPVGDDGSNDLTDNYRDDDYDYDNSNVYDPSQYESQDDTPAEGTGYDTSVDTARGSTYYLHGRNVMDDFMTLGPTQPMNEVDIQQIISDIPDGTDEHSISLVNNSIGDQLTPSILESLKEKGTVLKLDMNDDNGNRIATWTIDPSKMEESDTQFDFSPNINAKQYPRSTGEICVGYAVENYPSFAKLNVDLSSFGVDPSQNMEYYTLATPDRTPYETVSHNTVSAGSLGSYETPDTNFAFTTKTDEFYPEDYDLNNEYPWPSEQAAMIVSDEELQQELENEANGNSSDSDLGFDDGTGNTNPTDTDFGSDTGNQNQSLIQKLFIPICALGGIIVLGAIGGIIVILHKGKRPTNTNRKELEEDLEEEEELEEDEEEFEEVEEELEEDEEE